MAPERFSLDQSTLFEHLGSRVRVVLGNAKNYRGTLVVHNGHVRLLIGKVTVLQLENESSINGFFEVL